LANTLCKHTGIDNDVEQCLKLFWLDHGRVNLGISLSQPCVGEGRSEFVRAIMMVYAIGKPHLADVCDKSLPIGTFVKDGRVVEDVFQKTTYAEVEPTVLVPKNIPTSQCSLGEMIYV
jgi:hypothetical protein